MAAHVTERREMHMRKLIALLALTSLATLGTPGTALAAVEENFSFPVEGIVFTGEELCGETLTHTAGRLHGLITYTENDNRVSGMTHFQPQGAKLVDGQGRTYRGTGVGMSRFNEPRDENGAANFTTVDSFKFIGHGDAPNFLQQIVTHVTINANGEMTADFEFESVCK
jgi:hypothetical protein